MKTRKRPRTDPESNINSLIHSIAGAIVEFGDSADARRLTDGTVLSRQDWIERMIHAVVDHILSAFDSSIELQNHYIQALNLQDGGQRPEFADAEDWMARMFADAEDWKDWLEEYKGGVKP